MSHELDNFGILTPWDEWALEHCGLTANEMIEKYPEIFKRVEGDRSQGGSR